MYSDIEAHLDFLVPSCHAYRMKWAVERGPRSVAVKREDHLTWTPHCGPSGKRRVAGVLPRKQRLATTTWTDAQHRPVSKGNNYSALPEIHRIKQLGRDLLGVVFTAVMDSNALISRLPIKTVNRVKLTRSWPNSTCVTGALMFALL